MNHHSIAKKYFPALISAALLAASLFQFSRPVFSAGTTAGQTIRNTATGTYKDNEGNDYTIDSNTVEVTVAKVAGITNIPSGFSDDTSSATNTSVLTGDTVSFTFTITNVGNDTSNIHIPTIADIVAANGTKGLDTSSLVMTADLNGDGNFTAVTLDANDNFIVEDVPANGQIFIKVTGEVTATAAGAPIEVLLGDTGSNTDPNDPVADTQNQFDNGQDGDVAQADDEVRTLNPTTQTPGVTNLAPDEQKEASAVRQVFLGSNPLAAVKIEKTRGTVQDGATADLDDNIIPYDLELEVLTSTPSSLNTPGELEGRDFTGRMPAGIADTTNLILVSDAIPEGTILNALPSQFTENGRIWTPVYAIAEPTYDPAQNLAADQINWVDASTVGTNLSQVTRVGWVYDANQGTIKPGDTVSGFSFDVITDGLDPDDGGTVANIAQVFGRTFDGNPADGANGPKVFDESGDQDPSNFNGTNPGPDETVLSSRGLANPAGHGVDSENNNNANDADPDSPGGEDNVITIGAPGDLINGPDGQPAATGNVFITDPDNDHDFQNKGIDNFADANGGDNPQQGAGHTLNPNAVVFTNTLSNPGSEPLSNVLLQPINPSFDGFGGTDTDLKDGTKVTINLGTQQAIYTYTLNDTDGTFTLDSNTAAAPSQPIRIPTLAVGVPLDYTVTVDLPNNTELSTDHVDNDPDKPLIGGFPVPIIAFIDPNNNGTPDAGENSNYTVNQVYTGFIKVEKQVKVVRDGTDVGGMGFANDNADKKPLPGDVLIYRVNYRNISEPQVGNGNNLVLEGIDVMIDENGTLDNITAVTDGNNWGLDNNGDGDLDTINVQNTAADTSNGTITYYTGTSAANSTDVYSVDTLTSAGTTDPGDAVTGYRVTVPSVPPTAEDNPFRFTFQRKVDEFDGLPQDIDSLPSTSNPPFN